MKPILSSALFSIVFAVLAPSLMAQSYSGLPYQPVPAPMPPTPYSQVSYPSAAQQPLALPSAYPNMNQARPLKMENPAMGAVIPLELPGYELRVMDITKKITFDVNGSPVSADIPIFIYMPKSTASIADSSKKLREIYNDMILLYDQDRVDKERVRSMLKRLDSVIDAFDSITPSVSRHSSVAY